MTSENKHDYQTWKHCSCGTWYKIFCTDCRCDKCIVNGQECTISCTKKSYKYIHDFLPSPKILKRSSRYESNCNCNTLIICDKCTGYVFKFSSYQTLTLLLSVNNKKMKLIYQNIYQNVIIPDAIIDLITSYIGITLMQSKLVSNYIQKINVFKIFPSSSLLSHNNDDYIEYINNNGYNDDYIKYEERYMFNLCIYVLKHLQK
jgi:hypothetical protein